MTTLEATQINPALFEEGFAKFSAERAKIEYQNPGGGEHYLPLFANPEDHDCEASLYMDYDKGEDTGLLAVHWGATDPDAVSFSLLFHADPPSLQDDHLFSVWKKIGEETYHLAYVADDSEYPGVARLQTIGRKTRIEHSDLYIPLGDDEIIAVMEQLRTDGIPTRIDWVQTAANYFADPVGEVYRNPHQPFVAAAEVAAPAV